MLSKSLMAPRRVILLDCASYFSGRFCSCKVLSTFSQPTAPATAARRWIWTLEGLTRSRSVSAAAVTKAPEKIVAQQNRWGSALTEARPKW